MSVINPPSCFSATAALNPFLEPLKQSPKPLTLPQEKQAAPTSYASAARMAPSAPKDDPRPPRTGGAAAAKADGGGAAAAAGAPAAHKEPAEDIPNGIIVKKIPEGPPQHYLNPVFSLKVFVFQVSV